MNHYQKNGTLFDSKNGNIVLCRNADPQCQLLAHQFLYNSSVDRFFHLKENIKNT